MNTIHVQKTRWLTWAAAALLLGAANIAQAGWVTSTAFTSATATNSSPSQTVHLQGAAIANGNYAAGGYGTTLNNPTSIDGFSGSFTTYCVDLSAGLGTGPGLAGLANGTFIDNNGFARDIGAAAYVVNTYAGLTGGVFGTLGDLERKVAVQLAVWKAAYGGALTTFSSGNANINLAVASILAASTGQQSTAFFVNFGATPNNENGTGGFQDQIAAVPVPAALFFVAPALIGVLGGMRRKVVADQAMAA